MSMIRRIGFVDFSLENFHANVFLKLIREDLKDRGFDVTGCTALEAAGGRAWAQKNGVAWFDSVAAMDGQVDCYMVLAPSNPETHLDLCEQVLPMGKTTYVDKTFAPDLKTARAIFRLADRFRVPVQTTSVLRYTAVQSHVSEVGRDNVRHMTAFASGRSFEEYGIHPVEMIVSCMGPQVRRVRRRDGAGFVQLILDYEGDRTATVNLHLGVQCPFAAFVAAAEKAQYVEVDPGGLFRDGAAAILDFLGSATPNIAREESLAVRRVLDLASKRR